MSSSGIFKINKIVEYLFIINKEKKLNILCRISKQNFCFPTIDFFYYN